MTVSDSKPLITTVVPTYRRPTLLRRAIASILAQTYPHFRVCVYDNASGDETALVVEEFRKKDPRVEYVCRPNNIGAFANFVDAASHVKTPYFSFLPDDDILLPDFYEAALAGFHRHAEAAMSALARILMSPNGTFMGSSVLQWPEGLVLPPDGVFSTLNYGDPGLQANLIRKDVWDEFGGFDELTEPSSDLDFQLRVVTRLPIVVSRKIGAIGVLHGGSTTVRTTVGTAWPGWRRMADKFNQDTALPPGMKQRASAILLSSMKKNLIRHGIMKSISHGDWQDAEKGTGILVKEFPQSRAARTLAGAIAIRRRVPGLPLLLQALFGIRAAEKALLNLPTQWRFRPYSRFLRASTLAATTVELATARPSADEERGVAAVPRDMSAN